MRQRARQLGDRVGYHDLMFDLRQPGCPVCHGAHRAAWRFLDSLLWEYVNDASIRARLRATRGFCREHAMMALTVASQQAAGSGVAILYEDFLRHAREDALAAIDPEQRRRRRRQIRTAERCMACTGAEQVADNYLDVLAIAEEGGDAWKRIREPQRGLCLPHLAFGLRRARPDEEAARLVAIYLHGEGELRHDLSEFIRKQDYRYRPEGISDEQASSWRRAVFRMVGEPRPRRLRER
jgi:hypothetical protein